MTLVRYGLVYEAALVAIVGCGSPPVSYGDNCWTDNDCHDGLLCANRGQSGPDDEILLECTLTCDSYEDCPIASCGLMMHFTCGNDGFCDTLASCQ